jgi:hypothetical protein
LDGALDAIEDPAQDFLDSVPDAFALSHQLLEGDGVFAVMPGCCGGREHLMDGVEEGPTMMAEGVNVSGLEQANVVIDEAFKEVEKLLAIFGVVKGFHSGEVLYQEIGIRVVEGVVF